MAKITKPTINKQTWGKTGPHSLLVGKKLMAATGNIGVENSLDVKGNYHSTSYTTSGTCPKDSSSHDTDARPDPFCCCSVHIR